MIARDAKKMTRSRKAAADRLYEIRVQKILKKCRKSIKKAAKKSEDCTTVGVYDVSFVAWAHCQEVARRLKEEGYDTWSTSESEWSPNEVHILWREYD